MKVPERLKHKRQKTAAVQDASRTAGPESRFTVHGSPCSLLFDYEHEQEANRNSPVATRLILPNVPRFHRL